MIVVGLLIVSTSASLFISCSVVELMYSIECQYSLPRTWLELFIILSGVILATFLSLADVAISATAGLAGSDSTVPNCSRSMMAKKSLRLPGLISVEELGGPLFQAYEQRH